jgi:PEGA domain-containing protein
VVSAPVKPLAKGTSSARATPKRRTLVRRSILALGLCAALGGAGWAALRPDGEAAPVSRGADPAPVRTTPPPASAPGPSGPSAQSSLSQTQSPGGAERVTGAERPKTIKKEYALLTVASEPWGTLFLGNKEIGPTPIADYPLPIGTHRVRIEQEGYRTKFETIVVTGPNPIRRRYSLEPAGPQ